jgi:hypothetical protein
MGKGDVPGKASADATTKRRKPPPKSVATKVEPSDTGRFWIALWLILLVATAAIVLVAIELVR